PERDDGETTGQIANLKSEAGENAGADHVCDHDARGGEQRDAMWVGRSWHWLLNYKKCRRLFLSRIIPSCEAGEGSREWTSIAQVSLGDPRASVMTSIDRHELSQLVSETPWRFSCIR